MDTLRALNILANRPEDQFERLTRLAQRLFNVPVALVCLAKEQRKRLKADTGKAVKESPEAAFCSRSLTEDDRFVVPDTTKDSRFADDPYVTGPPDIRFYSGCALRYPNGHRLGTLCIIDNQPRTFSQEDMDALLDLAQLAEREIAAFQLATLDELTTISNRRGFAALAQQSLDICIRHQIPASLLYFDLDKLKPINDNFGHAEGDAILKTFSNLMARCFRASDVYGRLGGDEFAVLLTNATAELAAQVALRFQGIVDAHNKSAEQPYNIEFSTGIASSENSAEDTTAHSIDSLLKEADASMYQNKKAK